jgi:ribosomal protein L21E
MPNPWVSLRCDKLIPVSKAVNEKEQLEKRLEEEDKKVSRRFHNPCDLRSRVLFGHTCRHSRWTLLHRHRHRLYNNVSRYLPEFCRKQRCIQVWIQALPKTCQRALNQFYHLQIGNVYASAYSIISQAVYQANHQKPTQFMVRFRHIKTKSSTTYIVPRLNIITREYFQSLKVQHPFPVAGVDSKSSGTHWEPILSVESRKG